MNSTPSELSTAPPPELELISHHLCPYVQRSVIVLTEKNISHKRTYIDLNNKPQWFTKISATGKVPLLKIDKNHILFESMVICEYLDEITEGSLHPTETLKKAYHRSWNEFASQILNNISQLYNAKNSLDFSHQLSEITNKFSRIEKHITLPYFSGDQFSMTDAAFGPVFRYFDVLDKYTDADIFHGLEKTKQWRETLRQRKSIQEAVTTEYPELLTNFLSYRGSHISSLIEQYHKNITTALQQHT